MINACYNKIIGLSPIEESPIFIISFEDNCLCWTYNLFYAFASHPRALAPSTAASASLSSEGRSLTLPFHIESIFFSIELRKGFMSNSPLLARPPNKMNASGAENTVKSANASPSKLPVNSKMSLANVSPATAASYTSLEVMSSVGILRRIDSSERASRNSRAVRATPVAEQ